MWEENRGIGKSFGYNRQETYDDYNSAQLLILMLCDIVSRGGNFLLDIGPTADGRIPIIMEDRLIQIGEWLNVNGEAILALAGGKKIANGVKAKFMNIQKKNFIMACPILFSKWLFAPSLDKLVKSVILQKRRYFIRINSRSS